MFSSIKEVEVLFIRGHHPNEEVAYQLAEDIKSLFQEREYNVTLEDVDETRTNIWYAKQLLVGKEPKPHLAIRPGYRRAYNNENLVVFNFHNFNWGGKPPVEDLKLLTYTQYKTKGALTGNAYCWDCWPLKRYFVVEIPAIFSKEDEELRKGLSLLDELVKQSKAKWYVEAGAHNEVWHCEATDIQASREAGLMSDRLIETYSDGIEKNIIECLKNRAIRI